MKLRKIRESDCSFLFKLANDPLVRRMSFSGNPIEWPEHLQWFNAKLRDQKCSIYIAMDAHGAPIGQIRFDTVGLHLAEVDVSISPLLKGRRLGTELIALGTTKFFQESSIRTVHAKIRSENAPSIHAFRSAGYSLLMEGTAEEPRYKVYKKEKPHQGLLSSDV